ncbi:hypothetical protein N7516_006000 [Penicillium verrucosum]|uniref:uncharacterized protein n=1 Tax=Penicillium verrucosum TaxID=60171 RepID=UPI002544EA48|nr:uncharacterized protein N7516_006000 [Penicillium verrucosum]KAJ5931511.1 hypothetical protein N7516_006000 [Penicillium verrucosum]
MKELRLADSKIIALSPHSTANIMATLPEKQPFVEDRHARMPDKFPSTFVSSTVPYIFDTAAILAATHPTFSTADLSDDGWFISDFYAFNYLLKGLGIHQA